MLLYLRIENFALIDHLELDFGAGLNVLTGETGAGKSIILDAIDAVLGGKVSSRVIRTGTNRAIVEATFSVTPPLAAWLSEQEIDLTDDHAVIISREIATTTSNIRSRSRVNGVLVNRPLMAGLRDNLVEITAQGQTVQVGQSAQVRDWLDLYGGDALLHKRQNVAAAFIVYQQARQALEKRRTSERERLQQLDLLTYQVQELGAANLDDAQEMEQLNQERERLNHVVDLQQMSYKVYQALYQDDQETRTAADLLADGEMTLTHMVEYDSQLQSLLELVRDAVAAVMEVGRQISIYGEGLEADPQRLEEVDERIRELKQICRKYGPTLTEAISYYERIQTELAELNNSEQSIETLEQQEQLSLQELQQISHQLSQLRRQTAANLESRLLAELKPLAMDKVKFKVEIVPISPAATGADKITFMFSPNPGEPIQPLTEIASGGEMSRFLLALKACFHQGNEVGTMIFDEIDVGVSGRVAQAIAEKLHQLSQGHQVLCVTHQPLVAAMADRHFRVDKLVINKARNSNDEQRTVVRVTSLDNLTTRREELAQLAGGKSANEAISFAESLLLQAANHRERGK
ncbi:DNA repair protein RecN [Dolichospermum sp. UHCC 0684]|jgi:DNA repair protein RecN (Recombination protein N)|uniref:DNA repair protein RecN n=1 Tax=Nostocales TaxID=1161 RepID=UPI00029B6D02|nr:MULTISPECIES: DNA repair protein RecN [Nostocales]AFW93456.1 DNA repair protein RecN [Anabaena sp. 90]MEA5528561.1 DNA repair protein RecN [Dolichospermum sp. UHCC 0684]MTJ16766.1 DNA repair protein RecN [Dolichospermum sp. UHCC 0299]MTJ33776.1 DNA repair protein RecN [Dolichospermum sp. UHCC 0260]MTJ40129.1 DNA repair protein RecN [Dolichospermum sp. UHCC 0406]